MLKKIQLTILFHTHTQAHTTPFADGKLPLIVLWWLWMMDIKSYRFNLTSIGVNGDSQMLIIMNDYVVFMSFVATIIVIIHSTETFRPDNQNVEFDTQVLTTFSSKNRKISDKFRPLNQNCCKIWALKTSISTLENQRFDRKLTFLRK